jgi:hypothetical protein
MSRLEAAAAMDRLPWLPDEPKAQPAKRRGSVLIWASAAVALVAAGGFWVGVKSAEQIPSTPVKPSSTATTVRLPEPRPVQPQVPMAVQPQVSFAPQPLVRPAPAREVRIYVPVDRPATHETTAVRPAEKTSAPIAKVAEPSAAVAQPAQPFVMPRPWNPRIFAGAAGRVVQIGAFGSIHQSKQGWWYMVRAYPAVAHLPAVVRPSRNSKGRTFYRFQIGTTSQAHSEVLCQRMEKIHLSCAVVGLPWKAKVER